MAERRAFFLIRLLRGMAYPFRGARMLWGDRRLLTLAMLPFALCLLLYVGFFAAVVLLADDAADLVIRPGTWWRDVLHAALVFTFPILFLIVAAFTYTISCFVVAGPLYEWLSAGVERRVLGEAAEEPFTLRNMLVDLARGLGHGLAILLVELVVLVAGLLLVPVTTVLAVLASAVLLAAEYLEYPMERRRMSLRSRRQFVRRHFWELMGLGLPLLAGLAVPLVGVLSLPFGVVGGTLLFLELEGRASGSAHRVDRPGRT